MIEYREKYIGDVKYHVTQFPARRSLKIKTKLLKLIAPSAFSLTGGLKAENILDTELDSKAMSIAVQSLMDRLDADECVNLIMELLSCTRREGKEITESHFDMVYAGNFGELFKALVFVLEVNYGSFFQELRTGSLVGKITNTEQS